LIFFSNHKAFCKPAVRFPGRGRPSGGVVVLIKSEHVPFVKQGQYNSCGNFLVFIIDKLLIGLPMDVLYTCAYIPPEGSSFYTHFDVDNGVCLLEECLNDCLINVDDVFYYFDR
jgi:hypothetical protein